MIQKGVAPAPDESAPESQQVAEPGASAVSWLVRRALPPVFFGIVAALAAVWAAGPITDPDPWWHVRLGDEFRDGWAISDPGQLSPFATQPWVATQWTLEVLASYVEDWFGLLGIAVLTGLALVVLAQVLWSAARMVSEPLPAALTAALALLAVYPVVAPRPQIASLILLGIFAIAWARTSVDHRVRWWLLPLSWLWACTHGFWFVGAMLGLAVTAGLLLDRSVAPRRALLLGLVPVGSVFVAGLTPAGPRLLLAPFMVSGIKEHILEWQPPSFTDPFVLMVGGMAAIVAVTWARRGPVPWTDVLVFLLAGALLVYAGRTVALAAVLLTVPTAAALQQWLPGSGLSRPRPTERLVVRGAAVVAAMAVLTATLAQRPYVDPYPDVIDSTLAALPEDAVVLNTYAFGGWLSWRHPDLVHGIDGMTEAYPPAYLDDYLDALKMRPGWEDFVDRIGATHAFLATDAPIAHELQLHLDWTVLARTKDYVILERPGS